MHNEEYKVGHFLPDKLRKRFTKSDKIEYKGIQLKTAYLTSIVSDMVMKHYFRKDDEIDKETKTNLSSLILKSKYGQHYNYYMNYLLDEGIFEMPNNYYNGGKNAKAKTYKVNPKYLQYVNRCWTYDRIISKKNKREYLIESHKKFVKSPIPLWIRNRLVDDLFKVEMEFDDSMNYLDMQKEDKLLSHTKYMKNIMSVKNIAEGQIYFNFDNYGRMHTNYTNLKKEIRKKHIKIDGENICEIDLENSQPLFLSYLMKQEMPKKDIIKQDVTRYIELVTNGLIYEEIVNKSDIVDRDDAKKMMFHVLFGNNGETKKYNKIFHSLFPDVFVFLKNYKKKLKDYRKVSHKLQNLESEFIYNNVICQIYEENPDIKLFTVHDSICFPCKYRAKVEYIFNLHKRKLTE